MSLPGPTATPRTPTDQDEDDCARLDACLAFFNRFLRFCPFSAERRVVESPLTSEVERIPLRLDDQSHLLVPRRLILSQAVAKITLAGGGSLTRARALASGSATSSSSEQSGRPATYDEVDEEVDDALSVIVKASEPEAAMWRQNVDRMPEPAQAALLHLFLRDVTAGFQRFQDEALARRGSLSLREAEEPIPLAGGAFHCTRLHRKEELPEGSLVLVLEEYRNKRVEVVPGYVENTENDGDHTTYVRLCGKNWLSCSEKCANKNVFYLTSGTT